MSLKIEEIVLNLQDPNEETRKSAVITLTKLNTIEAIPYLKKCATDDDSFKVRYYAKKGLHSLKKDLEGQKKGIVEESIEVLKNSPERFIEAYSLMSEEQKIQAIKEITLQNITEMISPLIQELKTEKSNFVISCLISAIGMLGNEKHLSVLLHFRNHKDARIRANCVDALNNLNTPKSCPSIIEAVSDSDPRVRNNAIKALKNQSDLLPFFEEILSQKDLNSKMLILHCIHALEDSRYLPVLLKLLEIKHTIIRKSTLSVINSFVTSGNKSAELIYSTLSKINPETDQFLREVEKLSQDFSKGVQKDSKLDKLLQSSDKEDNCKAIHLITSQKMNEFKNDIIVMLDKCRDEQRINLLMKCIFTLEGLNSVNYLTPFLQHENHRIRAYAVELIGKNNSTEVKRCLKPFLSDSNNRVRGNAIIALRNSYELLCLKTLQQMSESTDLLMNKTAIYIISDFNNEKTIRFLKPLILNEDEELSLSAIDLLEQFSREFSNAKTLFTEMETDIQKIRKKSSPIIEPPLSVNEIQPDSNSEEKIEIEKNLFELENQDPTERIHAIQALAEIGDYDALEQIREKMQDENQNVRMEAQTAFSSLLNRLKANQSFKDLRDNQSRVNLSKLGSALDSANREEKLSALQTLTLRDSHTVKLLSSHLKDEQDEYVISSIIIHIGIMGTKENSASILPFLKHPDQRVRSNTVESLGYLCDSDSLYHLIFQIQDEDLRVKENIQRIIHTLNNDLVSSLFPLFIKKSQSEKRFSDFSNCIILIENKVWIDCLINYLREASESDFYELLLIFSENLKESSALKVKALLKYEPVGFKVSLLNELVQHLLYGKSNLKSMIEETKIPNQNISAIKPKIDKENANKQKKKVSKEIQAETVKNVDKEIQVEVEKKSVEESKPQKKPDSKEVEVKTEKETPIEIPVEDKLTLIFKKLEDDLTSTSEKIRKEAVNKLADLTDHAQAVDLLEIAENDTSYSIRFLASKYLKPFRKIKNENKISTLLKAEKKGSKNPIKGQAEDLRELLEQSNWKTIALTIISLLLFAYSAYRSGFDHGYNQYEEIQLEKMSESLISDSKNDEPEPQKTKPPAPLKEEIQEYKPTFEESAFLFQVGELIDSQEFDKAITYLKNSRKKYSKYISYHESYIDLMTFNGAQQELEKQYSNSSDPFYDYYRGLILYPDLKSEPYFIKASKNPRISYRVLEKLGNLYSENNMTDKAIDTFHKCFKSKMISSSGILKFLSLLEEKKDYQNLLKMGKAYLIQNPDNQDVIHYMAIGYGQLGDIEKAKRFAEKLYYKQILYKRALEFNEK